MIFKLLTEHHLEFLSLKGGCTGTSESTLVKMSNCWKSHVTAQFCNGFPCHRSYINSEPLCKRDLLNKQNCLNEDIWATGQL